MSNINRHHAGAKQAGQSVGGQFAATQKTEASGTGLTPEPLASPVDRALTGWRDEFEAATAQHYAPGELSTDEVTRGTDAYAARFLAFVEGEARESGSMDAELARLRETGGHMFDVPRTVRSAFDERRRAHYADEVLDWYEEDPAEVRAAYVLTSESDDAIRAAAEREYDEARGGEGLLHAGALDVYDDTGVDRCENGTEELAWAVPDAECREQLFEGYERRVLSSVIGEDFQDVDEMFERGDASTALQHSMREDLAQFMLANRAEINEYLAHPSQASKVPEAYAQLGQDFWLTRNGYGTGFWDRGLGDLGVRLSASARTFGEAYARVGEDGRLYG
ncbi:hypothetical protein ACXR2T_10075 [Leucobacter sp. HY1910]